MEIKTTIESNDLLRIMRGYHEGGNVKIFADSLDFVEFEKILKIMNCYGLDTGDIIGDVHVEAMFIATYEELKELDTTNILFEKINNNKFVVFG